MRRTLLPTMALVVLIPLAALAKDTDKLAPLSFLVGTWEASSAGTTASTTFERSLNGKIIVRHGSANYAATATTPAMKHEDLLVIYPLGDKLRADYFDSEGYVVPYEVKVTGRNSAVLTSDAISGAPRARITYKIDKGGLSTNMEIAPAATPDKFAPYLAWDSKKAK